MCLLSPDLVSDIHYQSISCFLNNLFGKTKFAMSANFISNICIFDENISNDILHNGST